jgi:hypothetical protein
MKRNTLNYCIDAASFTCFSLLTSTGLLLYFVLPPGNGHRAAVWGMGRHDWGEIHLVLSLILLALMVVHLMLHWKWIRQVTKECSKKISQFSIYSVCGALLVLGLSIAPFLSPVERIGGQSGTHKHGHRHHR